MRRFFTNYRLSFATEMAQSRLVVTFLILLSPCLGQERGGTDSRGVLPILSEILGKAGVSGSLEYWGSCRLPGTDVPPVSYPSDDSGSAVELLRKFFSSDPWMRVTQQPNGLIRMVETDVPTDLLDVTISHLSFKPAEMAGGANSAVNFVLSAPEVKAYRKEHNIGPFSDLWYGHGDSSTKQRVSGDLYNVTVKQALGYVVQFYPGFWIYENCVHSVTKSGREVFLSFYPSAPPHIR
jgi:hypothetical protein